MADASKLYICVPNYRGWIEAPHHLSMLHLFHKLGSKQRQFVFLNPSNTILSSARQYCINGALADPECERVLFIDDDMTFGPEQFFAMEQRFRERDLDYLCALAFSNSLPTKPCIFGRTQEFPEDGERPWWHIISDYPVNKVFEVYASGFGMVLMSKRMLEAMRRDENGNIIEGYEHFWYPSLMKRPPNEDVAFGLNARKKGFRLHCDSGTSIGHISKERPIISEAGYRMQGDWGESASNIERRRLDGIDAVPCAQYIPRPPKAGVVARA